jgi:hypothetical protein
MAKVRVRWGVQMDFSDCGEPTARWRTLVTVYWPFVVFQRSRRGWNVTHAPSGYRACEAGSRRLAVAKIQTLRALADWEWRR